MNRRAFLAVIGASASAGCSTIHVGSVKEVNNPWGEIPISVGTVQPDLSAPNLKTEIRDALGFWEQHAQTYVDFPVKFEYDPNNSNPDLEIQSVDVIKLCRNRDADYNIVDCSDSIQVEIPATAQIRVADELTGDDLYNVLLHQIGHTLGLTHADEPQNIMAEGHAHRIPGYGDGLYGSPGSGGAVLALYSEPGSTVPSG